MSTLWPDYCKRETLAKRLNLPAGAIDQLVKRGLLPAPIRLGDALLFRWADVDSYLRSGKMDAPDDPYETGARRAAQAAATRPNGAQ